MSIFVAVRNEGWSWGDGWDVWDTSDTPAGDGSYLYIGFHLSTGEDWVGLAGGVFPASGFKNSCDNHSYTLNCAVTCP